MRILAAILSLLIAVAGWHYLFYSMAAVRLSEIEDERINRRRERLRRFGGVIMLLLAGFFFAGFWTFDFSNLQGEGDRFILIWGIIALLIAAVTVLGVIDLRLTAQLRRSRKTQGFPLNETKK